MSMQVYCLRKRHNIVLMSEITAETAGVIWLGEGCNSGAVIHSTKSAIVLGGAWKQKWIDEGQKKCWGERVTSVTAAHLWLVAGYQPLWQYGEETIEIYRRELEEPVTTYTNQEWLIIMENITHISVMEAIGSSQTVLRVLSEWGLGTVQGMISCNGARITTYAGQTPSYGWNTAAHGSTD